MATKSIELVVRGVRMVAESDGLPTVLVGPCNRSDVSLLSVHVGPGDAHALQHELLGQATTRSQAVSLLERVAAALRGEVVAAHLVSIQPGLVTGAIEIDTPHGVIQVPTEPGQALSVAVCLGLPLLADRAIFGLPDAAEPPLEAPLGAGVTSFLSNLDLSILPDPAP